MIKVAAGNRQSGKEVMALLLDQSSDEVKITEVIKKESLGKPPCIHSSW